MAEAQEQTDVANTAEPAGGAPDGPAEANPTAKREKPSVTVELIRMAERHVVKLYMDETDTAFARVPVRDHREDWPLEGSAFRRWIAGLYYRETRRAAHHQAIKDACAVLWNEAYSGGRYALALRVARLADDLWYDLCDARWRAVRITHEGWEIVDTPPVLFRRFEHQRPQVEPATNGGDALRFLDFVNAPRDRGVRLLLLVYLVSCFLPDIPHPVLVVTGPQGSAKTSLHRFIRLVVDPSTLESLRLRRDDDDLVQALDHNWFAAFDNVTTITPDQSDILCRAVTGEANLKRKLYTDDEDSFCAYRRCVGLNGVAVPATRPDLLDRCLTVTLEAVDEHHRKRESDLVRDFEAARPVILGGCFDVLSKALARGQADLPRLPRLADWAAWGASIAVALGFEEGEFMDAYRRNIADLNDFALQCLPFVEAVVRLMDGRGTWEGTATRLREEAAKVAEDTGIGTDHKTWPGNESWTTRRLQEGEENLRRASLFVATGREGKQRTVRLTRRTEAAS